MSYYTQNKLEIKLRSICKEEIDMVKKKLESDKKQLDFKSQTIKNFIYGKTNL